VPTRSTPLTRITFNRATPKEEPWGLFHKSAIFFAPAFFISKIKVNKTSVISFVAVAGVAVVFKRQITEYVIQNFFDKYTVADTGAGMWMLMCAIIVVFGLVLHPAVKKSIGNSVDPLYMLVMTGLGLMIFASVANNAMRVANYYYMFVILFIPEVINAVKNRRILSLVSYIVTIACLLMYMYFLKIDEYNMIPYQFFWQ